MEQCNPLIVFGFFLFEQSLQPDEKMEKVSEREE